MKADFMVIDPDGSTLLARRHTRCKTLGERLFALIMLGDDRSILETWASGRCQHQREEP